MKSLMVVLLVAVVGTHGYSQKAAVALEGDHTLLERFALMKGNSQTFQDYKVIKESVLDGVWRIALDSVRALESSLTEAESRITQLEQNQKGIEALMKQKEEAMAEMEYDSTHVTVLGLSLSKALFISVTGFTFLGLLVLAGASFGAFRLSQRLVREKDLSLFGVNAEFDDFRKKALEKEVKLSRELQSERNKLMELRSSH